MKKIIFTFFMVAFLICILACTVNANASSYALKNWQQDEPYVPGYVHTDATGTYSGTWWYKVYGLKNFGDSGCGIMSFVNAVHYATGNFMDPLEVADWAYSKGYYLGKGGTSRKMYPNIEAKFGARYGFKVVNTGTVGKVSDAAFVNHIKNGGTAVVLVKGHYMAIVDYNESTKRFLLWDNCAGDGRGGHRAGATHKAGDWYTAAQLQGAINSEYLTVKWYCLISAVNNTPYKCDTKVVSGGGKVGFNDDCSYTSQSILAGTKVSFRVTPNDGYVATKVVVGGSAVSLKNNGVGSQVYSFTMPAGAVTIKVTFEKITYACTAANIAGLGKVGFNDDCSLTSQKIQWGTTVYYRVTPETGYKAAKVTVNGTEVELLNEGLGSQVYSFTMPKKAVSIEATFVPVDGVAKYVLSINATGNGKFTHTKAIYEKGTTVAFRVIPDEGYYCAAITLNGKTVPVTTLGKEAVYKYKAGAENMNVTIKFKKIATTAVDTKSIDDVIKLIVFDAKYYADGNADLKEAYGYDEEKLWNHFVKHGISEGRRGSKIFDVRFYVQNNYDLWEAYGPDFAAAFNHFITTGVNEEGRVSSADFWVKAYKANWEDLRKQYGSDIKRYYKHYAKYGAAEGRKCL